MLVSAVNAYVEYSSSNSLPFFEKKLRDKGLLVACGEAVRTEKWKIDEVAKGVPLSEYPTGDPAFAMYINQIVGRALKQLPEADLALVTDEAKQEVARLTRQAVRKGWTGRHEIIVKGEAGKLRYELGLHRYSGYTTAIVEK